MNFIRRIFYTLWYFRHPPWDTNITPPELTTFIAMHPPGKALDLGCGTGTNVITLANHGWQATGIDFVPKAIRAAHRKARRARVNANFIVGDVTNLSKISDRFDLILDIGCFHSLGSKEKAAYTENFDRYLVPGGHFLLYVIFKMDAAGSGPGAVEADLEMIVSYLSLVSRKDGTERGTRPSSWLTYRKAEG
jgi:cyclopropane fatty-acyl-phospholipid synthase-like methyltransferase